MDFKRATEDEKRRLGQIATLVAADLPQPPDPKVPKGGVSIPVMFQRAKQDTTSQMIRQDRQAANTDLTSFRTQGSTLKVIQAFAKIDPQLSSAVDSYLRTGLTKYTVRARNRITRQIDPVATNNLMAWIAWNDKIGDISQGFSPNLPLSSIFNQVGQELRHFGAFGMELVLDKGRMPARIQPVGIRDLVWFPDKSGQWATPKQQIGGVYYDLDIPTFFYTSLDQSLYSAYPDSPLEPAMQPVLMAQQFLNDVRRVLRGAVQPRVRVQLSTDQLMKLIPPEAQSDPDKAIEFFNKFITDVAANINGLEPDEALVVLDTMEVDILQRGNTSLGSEYDVINKMAEGKLAAGAKTLPSVLGLGGNQTTASTESMLFIKAVEGALQAPLNAGFSRLFTMASRLMGNDVYVEFEFDPIDLRPKTELEAFFAQRQARVLEQLSEGFISDEEASIDLTGDLPMGNFTPLSGTGFYTKSGQTSAGNPYSGTSVGGDGGGGAQNEALMPKTPAKKAGSNKGVN